MPSNETIIMAAIIAVDTARTLGSKGDNFVATLPSPKFKIKNTKAIPGIVYSMSFVASRASPHGNVKYIGTIRGNLL